MLSHTGVHWQGWFTLPQALRQFAHSQHTILALGLSSKLLPPHWHLLSHAQGSHKTTFPWPLLHTVILYITEMNLSFGSINNCFGSRFILPDSL